MGYYSGNGVETGGGQQISLQDTVISGGTLIRERLTTKRVLVKRGVSEATAKGATPTRSSRCGNLTNGAYIWPTPNMSATEKNYSWARIDDSNLFELVEETTSIQMRLSVLNGAGVITNGTWAALP